jgi:hypothetical protein
LLTRNPLELLSLRCRLKMALIMGQRSFPEISLVSWPMLTRCLPEGTGAQAH